MTVVCVPRISTEIHDCCLCAQEKYGPVGLVHIDAHTDTYGPLNGFDIWHGSPFRLAVEEGLLDCSKVWQIGLRGSGHSAMDAKWGTDRVSHAPESQNTRILLLCARNKADCKHDVYYAK